MKRIENLPLHFMPKQSLDNILNDDIYNKDFINNEILKLYETMSKFKPIVVTLIDDETGEEIEETLNF